MGSRCRSGMRAPVRFWPQVHWCFWLLTSSEGNSKVTCLAGGKLVSDGLCRYQRSWTDVCSQQRAAFFSLLVHGIVAAFGNAGEIPDDLSARHDIQLQKSFWHLRARGPMSTLRS